MQNSPQIHSLSLAPYMHQICLPHGQFGQSKQLYKWFIGANNLKMGAHNKIMGAIGLSSGSYFQFIGANARLLRLYGQVLGLYFHFIGANKLSIQLFGWVKGLHFQIMGANKKKMGAHNSTIGVFYQPIWSLLLVIVPQQCAAVIIGQHYFIQRFSCRQCRMLLCCRKLLRLCRPP